MPRYFHDTILLGAVLLMASCGAAPTSKEAAVAASFTPTRDMSLIYVYRPAGLLGAAVNSRVSMDGRSKGELPNGKFMCFETVQGNHELLAGGRSIRFSAKSGECYFFMVNVSSESQGHMVTGPVTVPILGFNFQGQQVDANEARSALQKISQVAVKDAPISQTVRIIRE
ncbi:MAG: DUF2846 domain-containing protein [Luteolibacter sp.]|uniref:DUF2846 domain-containing protein n=1 Tax=Luteolibacter sp. TaxID=1962973 RepID=UPI003266DC1E